ncbi:MAG: WD40 repeat domain-containing protein [Treponema sp.]|nr:WD40 repeat domain-containing protein [Treponema sp.]
MNEKQKQLILIGVSFFIIYIFVAARPIPIETILSPRWFISLESNYPIAAVDNIPVGQEQPKLLPFYLGGQQGRHFGYVDENGNFTINQALKGNRDVSFSADNWVEYDAIPHTLEVRNPLNQLVLKIEEGRGYPLFLDQRIFLLGSGQNSLSALNDSGAVLWTYDFAAPVTVMDAASGFVLAGLLDGTVEVLNQQGKRIFFFEPGGSRRSVIYGCAISQDGSRLAVISGIDLQRFLLLERYGNENPEQSGSIEYKVIYHEFLEEGFRRPVHIEFIDNDSRIAFERQGGVGLYEIRSRTSLKLPLAGEIKELDTVGRDRLLFIITAQGELQKHLVAVRLPGTIIIEAPFKSKNSFLGRRDSRIYVGGNMTLASFELEKK